MSGYNGLGISKKAITSKGGLYSIEASDIIDSELHIREDFLNKTVILKTSVTDYYISIFLKEIGKDGDFIKFKNVDDVTDGDYAYVEFYDDDYSGNIFVPQIWGHMMEYHNVEFMFVKEGEKWRKLNTTGLMKIDDDPVPLFDSHSPYFDKRNIHFNSEIMFREGSLSETGYFGSRSNVIRLTGTAIDIYQKLRPTLTNATDIGETLKRFKTLFAQNADFIGTVKAADPVDATDLVNKQYLENNLNPAFLYDELDEMFISNDDLYLDGWNIKDLGDPFELQDAATKNYVDNELLAKGAKLFPRFRSKLILPLGSVSGSIYTENDLTGIAKLKPVDELDILKSCFSDGNKGYIDGWNNPKMVGIINFKTSDKTTFQQVKVHLCKRDTTTRTVLKTVQLNVRNNYRSEITFEFDLVGYIQATYNWYYLEIEPITTNTIADIELDVEYFIK